RSMPEISAPSARPVGITFIARKASSNLVCVTLTAMLTDLIGWFGRRGIYYGWVIVAVMFVTLFVSNGFRFAFGVYYSAILDETGWGRAETAGGGSAAMIVDACPAALAGYLFDRLGARVLFPIGALSMGAGLMLCSASESLAGLTVSYGILLG